MKKIIVFSLIFAILGCCILVGSIGFCLNSLNSNAIMVQTPPAALECSENLMNAIQAGDYAAAADYLYGQVDLGVNREPEGDISKFLWNALEESMTYEFIGDCYATTTGIARDVWITTLDPASVNQNLSLRVEELAESGEVDIYDNEGNIQQDILNQLLMEALEDALAEDATTTTRQVRLNLVYQSGKWWVVPDAALLQAISGGVAG